MERGTILGQQMCRTLLKTHIISGCDVTSKFGTKAAEYYLLNFGKSDKMIGFQEAAKYLVQLLQKTQSVIVLESSGMNIYQSLFSAK